MKPNCPKVGTVYSLQDALVGKPVHGFTYTFLKSLEDMKIPQPCGGAFGQENINTGPFLVIRFQIILEE